MPERADVEILTDRIEVMACSKCGHLLQILELDPFSEVECPQCHTRHRVPVRLGHFLLVQLLGKGGMGAVYKALDETLGRYVALKVMRKELGDHTQSFENFLREARAAAALNHPNVVQIYSCGQEKGQPYIVMELVDGGRLDAVMGAGKPVDEARLLQIGVHVAQGLGAAHEIGLVHGDVKPANVLFGRDGTAKVVDFGLARFAAAQQAPGEIWGTPFYIAPEKVQKLPEDHRSDIYSLGATLFHALAGKPPFDGETSTDVVVARLKEPVPDILAVRPVQIQTARLISRMLEVDPARRYPTYTSLLADMRAAAQVAKNAPPPVTVGTEEKPSAKGLMMTAVILLLILAGAGYGGYRWYVNQKAEKAVVKKTPTKYKLVGGKLVPVYEEETPAPAAPPVLAADTNAPPTPPSAPPSQLFSAEQQTEITGLLKTWADAPSAEAEKKLEEFYQRLPVDSQDRAWVRICQAVTARIGDHPEAAANYLKEVRNASFPDPGNGQKHPGYMARDVARFLLGDLDQISLYSQSAQRPGWYRDLLVFFTGLQTLQKGNISEARAQLSEYADKSPGDPGWPYGFQPLAARWTGEIDRWTTTVSQVSAAMLDHHPDQAREMLVAFRASTIPSLHRSVDRELERVQAAASQQAEDSLAQRKKHQEDVQKDLDRLDAVRESNAALVSARGFKQASAQLRKTLPDITTGEGKEFYHILLGSYQRMNDLQDFLIGAIQANPFGQAAGSEVGGTVLGATHGGLRISLGGQGEMLKPWDQVSARLILWMANYYLSGTSLPEKERADKLLSLALFCYEGGGFDLAAQYARQAGDLNPELKTDIRKFMPDLLAE